MCVCVCVCARACVCVRARDKSDHLQAKGRRGIKRRRLDPKSDLNSIFENAWKAMWQDEKSVPFRSAVDSRTAPQYRTLIKTPIDLNIIKTRLSESYYNTKKCFLEDVNLMVSNCRTYNESRDPRLVCIDTHTHTHTNTHKHTHTLCTHTPTHTHTCRDGAAEVM